MNGSEVLLSVRNLSVAYDSIQAVREASFDVRRGEIVTLIGGNGAGKTSILRAISGMIPYTGSVVFEDKDLQHIAPDRIVGMGIVQVPEGRGIFGNLTVLENLKLATWQRRKRGWRSPPQFPDRILPHTSPSPIESDLEHVFTTFPRLRERQRQPAGTLSGGEQQMLAVGRALMTRARLMLLDEPSMGLAPVLVRDIFRVLREINQAGTTLLLVEQNAHMALNLAHRACVLETGAIVLSGTGKELLGTPRVREAYLGG